MSQVFNGIDDGFDTLIHDLLPLNYNLKPPKAKRSKSKGIETSVCLFISSITLALTSSRCFLDLKQ